VKAKPNSELPTPSPAFNHNY